MSDNWRIVCHGVRVKSTRDYETYRDEHEISIIDVPNKEFIENYCDRLGIIDGDGLELLHQNYGIEYMVDSYTVYYAELKRNIDIRQLCLIDLLQ